MLEKALLDSAATDALLQLAYREGLLFENRRRTDAFLTGNAQRPVPDWVKERVLQQIVLTPALETIGYLPHEGLSGPLIENGFLTGIKPDESEAGSEQVPAEIIHGMLCARGHEWSPDEMMERVDRIIAVADEAEQYRVRTGRSLPTSIQRMLAATTRFGQGVPFDPAKAYGDYSQEDIDMAIRHDQAASRAQPVTNAIDELTRMIAYGRHSDTLIRPSFQARAETRLLSKVPQHERNVKGARAMSLFRVIANEIDAPTARDTLRDTLVLASSSAAKSLRELLPLWLEEIAAENLKPATLISREIRKANAELKRVRKSREGGRLLGYIELAIDAFNLPNVAGLTMQYIGQVLTRKNDEREQRSRWLLLGEREVL